MKSFLLGLLVIFWSHLASGQTLYTFNGGGTTGNWNTASTWTTDPTGSTSVAPRVPTNNDNVVVTNSFVLTLDNSVAATGLSVTVQRGGVLDLTTSTAGFANTLTRLAGQGTLRIGRPYFPAVTTNDFDDANTGTVEFYNWPTGASVLPAAGGQYNNLRLLNTTTGTGTAFTAQLNNDLTLMGSLTLTRTNATAFPSGNANATKEIAAAKAGVSFMLGKDAASRTLTVLGDVTIGAGTFMGVTAATATHIINASGNFINNGTVNLHNGTVNDAQVAVLVFKGTTDATFFSNGDTDLDILKVDKGIDSQVLLNVTSSGGLHGGLRGNLRLNHIGTGVDLLVLVNGIAKLGTNVYLAKIHSNFTNTTGNPDNFYEENWFQLGSSATSPTLWIAGGEVYNDNATTFVIYGTLRVSSGLLQTLTPDAIVVREDAQVLIEGGKVLCEKFRPSLTSANHRGSFIMTGGEFECRGSSASASTDGVDFNFARFAVPYLTQAFRMSGGTIRVYNANNYASGIFHIGVNPDNAQVTGGTIEVYLPASNNNGNILTTAPLWNLTIKKVGAAGTSKAILANVAVPTANPFSTPNNLTAFATTTARPLTVLNNFSIDAANTPTFDADSKDVTIQGTFTINTGSTYLPGANTTTFSGGQNQLLTNNGTIGASANTFNNWVIDKSAGTLTLGGTAGIYTVAAAGTLSLLNGVLNDGGKRIDVLGNMVNSASHTSGGGTGSITLAGPGTHTVSGNDQGVFGNLRINSTATTGTVAATFTANMSIASVLTLQSTHILFIGVNRLSLTNVEPNAVGATNGFSSQCMIMTAGNQSDLGVQKTYGGSSNTFTFPVGTVTTSGVYKYTPAIIALGVVSQLTQFGQVSVSPTNSRNPFITGTAASNSLAYYWKVRSIGFVGIPTGSITQTFSMVSADAPGGFTTLNNGTYVGGRYLPVAWTNFNNPGAILAGNPNSTVEFPGLDQFEGEFTVGLPAAFGTVTAYYSIKDGNWNPTSTANSPWSTTGFNGSPVVTAPTASNPVFIGSVSNGKFHTIAVTAANARAGSLVIDKGSVLDVTTTTGHNFGALPDAKIGGSGRLRISSSGATAVFPGGDFGSFLQENGGTVEYYTSAAQSFTLPVTSLVSTTSTSTLSLNSYKNLWLNAATGRTITLPNLDLRVYAQLKTGVINTATTPATTYPGTVLLSAVAAGNLRADSLLAVQNGILRYTNGVARTLTADTDVRVELGATFEVLATGTAVANALNIGGSLTNNGTLNFNNTRTVNLTFTGSKNTSLTGTNTGAATTLATLTVNKGASRTPVLNVDVAGALNTPTSGWLTLTNGTLRYAKTTGTLTVHDANSPYSITDNAGLTVDAPGATVTVATNTAAPAANTSSASDLKLAGELQVLQGTLNVGTAGVIGNDLEYASAGAPTIRVGTGGTLYVNGQIRRTTANTNGSLRYVQSGGAVEIRGARAEVYQNNERGLLEVQGPGSIFRMTGGTLSLRGTNTRPAIIADLYLRPDSTVVTAGTVVLGNTASTPVTVSVESQVPLYDMRVEAGNNAASANTGLLTGLSPLNLKGSLTIANDFAFFNANGLPLNIDQNLVNNNSSTNTGLNNGGFQPTTATQTTTFTGKGPAVQQLTSTAANLTVFGGLVVNNAQTGGTFQLGRNARVVGTLTLAKGTLADNGQTLTALGDVNNSALHTSATGGSLTLAGTANQTIGGNGTGRFGNVMLNNSAGATTTANQEITSVLTLTSGVLSLGSNLLWLSNTAAGAVAGTFGPTNFIRTNGIVADQGVRKSYPIGASDFTFPIGAASKYTPVRMNVTSNAALGALTVQPIDLAHPSTTNAAARELSFYWKVRSTGFNAPVVTQVFTYVDNGVGNDVNGTEASYVLGRFLDGAWAPQNGIANTVNAAANTLTNSAVSYFDGDYTGGESSEFGEVPTFYSRNATAGLAAGANWDSPAAWTFNANGSDGPIALPTTFPSLANPVVIRATHSIKSNGPGRGAANLVLQGTLDLGANAANNFSTITGTGTLRIGSALFPAGNYSAFVAASGGTVDYTGAVQLPARDTYNNLTFSGSNRKQLSNLDLIINGALSVGVGAIVDNPTSQNITLTSTTSGATVAGTLNLNDGILTTGAFLTNDGNGTFNAGAGAVNIGTALTNGGTLNNGSGALTVGTAFSNSGTYNANVGTGDLTVGTTFTNSGEYVAGVGKLSATGNFSNTATGTFTAASGDVTTNGNFLNAGTYNGAGNIVRITGDFSNQGSSSAFFAGPSNMVLRGNFTNSGTFDSGTSLVQFIADAVRTLTGNTTFNNVQKLGSSTLLLGAGTNLTVANLLTMSSGAIVTGTSNILYLTNRTIQPIVGTGPGVYVAGRLAMSLPNEAASIRTFPVGLGGRFRPVTIKPQGVSNNPVVLVEIFNSPPAGSIDATLSNISANRYYRIQTLSGTIAQPTVQLSFNTDVVDEKVNVPGNMRVARSANGSSGPWSTAGGAGVFSPEAPRGYTISAATTINNTSFFALASTNEVDNPLTGSPAPLPVELLQFTAVRRGSAVAVAWATASEKNSAYFQVQRSADGRTFVGIERVEAQGNSSTRHNYATLDTAPLAGLSYYRLRQVDHDGKEAYSSIVAVRFEGQPLAPALVAYPNPASGQGFRLLATNLGTTGGTVRMFDNVGRLVLTKVAATGTIETSIQPARPLATGMYFVTWQTADGVKLTTKVTVE